jgi:hypothetical protein
LKQTICTDLWFNGNDVAKVLSPEADHGNFADYLICKAIGTGFIRNINYEHF